MEMELGLQDPGVGVEGPTCLPCSLVRLWGWEGPHRPALGS